MGIAWGVVSMKIYTKTGDKGETSLLGGKRVFKSCLEMEAIGEVDELNSWLGVLIEEIEEKFKREAKKLKKIQKKLFIIGSGLAAVQMEKKVIKKLNNLEIKELEQWIDGMEKKLPKLKNFINYEGTEEAVKAFYARAICRRVERAVVRLLDSQTSPCSLLPREGNEIKKYLNRLSDLLFVLGRWFNRGVGGK